MARQNLSRARLRFIPSEKRPNTTYCIIIIAILTIINSELNAVEGAAKSKNLQNIIRCHIVYEQAAIYAAQRDKWRVALEVIRDKHSQSLSQAKELARRQTMSEFDLQVRIQNVRKKWLAKLRSSVGSHFNDNILPAMRSCDKLFPVR